MMIRSMTDLAFQFQQDALCKCVAVSGSCKSTWKYSSGPVLFWFSANFVEWVTVTGVKSITVKPKLGILCNTQWDDTIDSQFSSTVLIKLGEERGVYRVLVGKPEGKRPLGRPRRRWVDNIKDGSPGGGMWVCGLDWADPG